MDQSIKYKVCTNRGMCALLVNIQRILGECLLISSLPDKASRKLVELQGLPSDSSCFLIAKPGKLDIKRCKPGILFISLLFKLEIMTLLSSFLMIQCH